MPATQTCHGTVKINISGRLHWPGMGWFYAIENVENQGHFPSRKPLIFISFVNLQNFT